MSSIRVVALVVLMLVAAGCSGGSDKAADLPQGAQALQQSSAAMRDLTSVGLTITTEGNPPLAIKGGDIKLLKNGDARGTLRLPQAGQTVETEFVLLGNTVYFKGATGRYQKVPKAWVAAVYDPSAVLDPQRGVVKLLTGVTGAQAEAKEAVNGRQAYRIKVTLPRATAGTLIPGISQDLPGKVWVGVDDHRLLKVRADLPGGKGTVTVTLTEFNSPYKITAPE